MKKSKTLLIAGLVLSFLFFCGFANESNVQAQTKTSKNLKKKRIVKKKPIKKVTQNQIDNLVGSWEGIFDSQPTKLEIESVNQSTFYGTMRQGGSEITFTGFVDKNTRRITMIETKVVVTDNNWVLGLNNGKLSNAGKRFWGSGKDANRYYSWTFTKRN